MNFRLTFFVLLLLSLLTFAASSSSAGDAAAAAGLYISEIRIDQPGDDVDEYVELSGKAGSSLDGISYLVIGDGAGGSGVIEAVIDLDGQTVRSSGFFVIAEESFSLGTADLVTPLIFENSDNVTHLLAAGFTGAMGEDLDVDDDGVLDSQPWSTELDRIALIEQVNPPGGTEYHYGPPTIGPIGYSVPNHVFSCPNSGSWKIGPYDPASGKDTPGGANLCETPDGFGDCGEAATFIYEVQGDGASSPLVGQRVVVEAIVHGDFQESDELQGFFVQEEAIDRDDDIKSSEGLYIDDVSLDVNKGELVRVQGEVEEWYGRTQLTDISHIAACSAGSGVEPMGIILPMEMERWEQIEGRAVQSLRPLYVSDSYNLGRYGELTLSVESRQYSPTHVLPPGKAAKEMQAENELERVLLDDGSRDRYPKSLPYFTVGGTVRAGDRAEWVTGALDYAYGSYRIQPTQEVIFSRVNERSDTLEYAGGKVTVASFNLLNYFTTIDEGQDNCGPSGDMGCRGADTEEEFQRQKDKIVAALKKMDADVVGLMEIENNADEAVADLVAWLNLWMGEGTYAYVDTGVIGGDAIKVAFIYKPATVELVGAYEILDASVIPAFNDEKNRPSLAQTFEEKGSGERFTAVLNHFKSKGSDCDDVGDPDVGDGQGNCSKTRTRAAEAVASWLETDPTGSGDPDFLILGNLNAYAKEDPIMALVYTGYEDLLNAYLAPEDRYSFVFSGQAGYLDHSLANASMARQVTGVTVWHINADEPAALDYNDSNQDRLYMPDMYRSSDHDPLIVGLHLGKRPTVYMPIYAYLGDREALNISGQVRAGGSRGAGLPGVDIFLAVAVYEGQVEAVTDGDGYYRIRSVNTQGHPETIRVWAEKDGYLFDPDYYIWVHQGYGSNVTRDFVAIESGP